MWSTSLITEPAQLPVLYEDAKKHLRLDQDDERAQIEDALIPAATNACETFTGRQLITATWELWLEEWCEDGIWQCGALFLPKAPVQSITHVKYVDTGGTLQTWATDQYLTELPAGPKAQRARIVPAYGVPWPSIRCQPKAVQIRFVAGYGPGPESVPAALVQGMLLEIGELYERREVASVGTIVTPNLKTAEALWWPYRAW